MGLSMNGKGIISNICDHSLSFRSYVFSHFKRTSNHFAHNIASLPIVLGDYKVWRHSLLPLFCNPDIGL